METILTSGFEWLSRRVPTFTFLICIVAGIVWVALRIDDFHDRVRDTERICTDINERQLPAIQAQIKALEKNTNEKFSAVEVRMSVMETQLAEIIKRLDSKDPKPK